MADIERTLVIVKPDGVQRGLTGEIVSRFERRGLKIVAMRFGTIDESLAKRHYAEHEGKPFYAGLVEVHHLGPVAGDGAGRPKGNRDHPLDRGQHAAMGSGAGHDSRRLWFDRWPQPGACIR